MPITLTLPAETERKLRERASRAGQDVAALARDMIERAIDAKPSLDDILAPFRRQVAESEVTDEDLTAIFDEARSEAWRAKEL